MLVAPNVLLWLFKELPCSKFPTWYVLQDVALFEMNQSDSEKEDSLEESSQASSEDSSESEDEDDSASSEVTIDNIKLPHSEDGKGKIEVLDSPASKRKK